jgi:hypothetical protein
MGKNEITYIYVCIVKSYKVLNVKNALVKTVEYIMENITCVPCLQYKYLITKEN